MAQYLHFSLRCHGAALKHRHNFTFSFVGNLGNVAGVGTKCGAKLANGTLLCPAINRVWKASNYE